MLYIFESTHAVINAENKLIEHGIKMKILPVPKSISPECGLAIMISDEIEKKATDILNLYNIIYSKHYDY